MIIYNCENCGEPHSGFYGSGRFCSTKCSRGFSTKEKRSLINEKVSKKLYKGYKDKICPECKKSFSPKKKKQIYCSVSCGISNNMRKRWQDLEYKAKMINFAKERHRNEEESFGWQSRKNLKMSYPEQVADRALQDSGINFTREFKIGKYFIDFAIPSIKMAIEIDGQQHKLLERNISDKKKDAYLKKRGWKIIRIQYPDENIRNFIKNLDFGGSY